MEFYVELYIFINVICTLILFGLAAHSRIGMGDTTLRRYFVAVIVTVVIYFVSDTIWFAMSNQVLPRIWWLGTLANNVYFLSVTTAGYLWFLFLLTLVREPWIMSQRNRQLALIPLLIHVALLLYNLVNPILFGIDANFTYYRGPLFIVQYLFYYLYTISVSIYAIRKAFHQDNYAERGHYLLVAAFPILPAISGTVQMLHSHIPFNTFGFMLAILIVYINELGQQVSQEPLTQLANRKQFMRVLEQRIQQHETDEQLYLFMMDLDQFKSINDTYGHYVGDQALIHVSEALKRAVGELHQRATLARYAGDEFAIIAYFDKPAQAKALKETIEREIEKQNRLITEGYQLRISIGVAQYTPEMTGLRDLLDAADAQLYEEKRRRSA